MPERFLNRFGDRKEGTERERDRERKRERERERERDAISHAVYGAAHRKSAFANATAKEKESDAISRMFRFDSARIDSIWPRPLMPEKNPRSWE